MLLAAGVARAGLITFTVVEDKGTVTLIEGHIEFGSYMRATLPFPEWGDRAGTYVRFNKEKFVIDSITNIHFWNIYPAMIHITQPIILANEITIPFFMATGTNRYNLNPLPTGGLIESAQLQDGYGLWHDAVITPLINLNDLPAFGAHGETYDWDLSNECYFDLLKGNFYLAQVTMTADAFSAPEPCTWLFLGLGTIIILRAKR